MIINYNWIILLSKVMLKSKLKCIQYKYVKINLRYLDLQNNI